MDWTSCLGGPDKNIATFSCLPTLFTNVTSALLAFSGVAALFFVIFSGIKFITSGGDPKQAEGARKTLTYAIMGLVVILLAYFIVNMVATLTGAKCIFNPLNPAACQ